MPTRCSTTTNVATATTQNWSRCTRTHHGRRTIDALSGWWPSVPPRLARRAANLRSPPAFARPSRADRKRTSQRDLAAAHLGFTADARLARPVSLFLRGPPRRPPRYRLQILARRQPRARRRRRRRRRRPLHRPRVHLLRLVVVELYPNVRLCRRHWPSAGAGGGGGGGDAAFENPTDGFAAGRSGIGAGGGESGGRRQRQSRPRRRRWRRARARSEGRGEFSSSMLFCRSSRAGVAERKSTW